MNIKIKPIEVPDDEPFKYDTINQQANVENFKQLIEACDDNLIISVDGSWGTGKTTFLRMLNRTLLNDDQVVVFVNSWESDFYKEPLPALISEFTSQSTTNPDLRKSLKKAGVSLLKSTVSTAIKTATAGIVDIDGPIDDFLKTFSEKQANSLLDSYDLAKDSIKMIKEEIQKIVEDADGKLYVLVDELDRCRPDYAIEFLELLKHVFNIDGVVFVIALDGDNLSKAINNVYGSTFDSVGYLRRFFDVTYSLPELDITNYIKSRIEAYALDDIVESRKVYGRNKYDIARISSTIILLSNVFKISLRDIQQFLIRVVIIISNAAPQQQLFPDVLLFLIILRHFNNAIYKKIMSRDYSFQELLTFFENNYKGAELLYDRYNNEIVGFFAYTFPFLEEDYSEIDLMIENEQDDEKKEVYKRVKESAQHFRHGDKLYSLLPYLKSKIEFTEKIEL